MKYVLPSLAVILIVPMLQRTVLRPSAFEKESLRFVIAIDGQHNKMRYAAGYNYEMLKKFSEHLGKETEIFLGGPEYIDSLRNGAVDLIVLPYADSLVMMNGYMSSIPVADSSSWVMGGENLEEIRAINTWLSHYFTTKEHSDAVNRFSLSYDPFRRASSGWRYSTLSPYDELIGRYAPQAGWDRYMLTALVWQESKFHIEVRSKRGALGLMQIMPHTASHFEASDLLDPEENISTAVKLINRLQRLFRDDAENSEELLKFTLAAYNAGEGRIKDCIAFAASIGEPHRRWDDLVAVIPKMRPDSPALSDSMKIRKFQGYETISYVESMMRLQKAFRSIALGPSSPGRPVKQKDTAAIEEPLSEDTKPDQQPELQED